MDNQNIINVDIDSRAVTLPVNFNLGVMNDISCKTITFMVQKKSDITDLTDLTFSINTISAKGTPDKIECTCREEGGFYIITAVLKGTIFEASGKAVFNLCGQKFDSSHVAVKAWGSEDITALVGSHSHADKAIEELYPSVLEELKQKVNNPNLTDEQLNNIATKVAEKGFYTKTEIDSMIANIAVPTRLSQLAEDDSHMTVTKAQRDKIDTFTGGAGTGLSTEAIDKLEEVGNCLAYTTADGGAKWTELISILRGSSSGGSGETEVTLSSISVTYTGGDVTVGTALTSLTGITVTGTYSDGTTNTVTGYTLSGEILEGENTITVSYGGKTTTFTVTGIVESGGGEATAELPTDGLLDFFDFRNVKPTIDTKQGLTSYSGLNGGSLFAWSASIGNTSDEHGSTLKRTLKYDKNGGTVDEASLGQNVTVVVHGYFTSKAWIGMGHTRSSNINGVLCETSPSYVNTSGSTLNMPYTKSITETGLSYPQYINMIISTDESNVYYYVNGELVATRSASEVEDFASWNDKIGLSITNRDVGEITATAIYNKTLSQVEVVEAQAYCKTLEVA